MKYKLYICFMIKEKICKDCGFNKPIECFRFNKGKSCYRNDCKECENKKCLIRRNSNLEKYRGLNKIYLEKAKLDPIKVEKIKESNNKNKKIYRLREKERNPEKVKFYNHKKSKEKVDELHDSYIVNLIKFQYGISLESIRENNDLIESFKEQIKTKRLLKNLKS